ncbi:hypothetical protein SISNIDRAFT_486699 [Sistotremastrum niveocremeum HHB9708]|uniref:Uncharacterized protein n=1 Tax=Sistotremastrum niveocremeum HHB9708 TaxID=1314777 RepID=A0A164T8V2_9AGAM|nr:hypothetical protein SISNIDRAFT_486699 [Sistotremastrum niveocremeum HHB9708]
MRSVLAPSRPSPSASSQVQPPLYHHPLQHPTFVPSFKYSPMQRPNSGKSVSRWFGHRRQRTRREHLLFVSSIKGLRLPTHPPSSPSPPILSNRVPHSLLITFTTTTMRLSQFIATRLKTTIRKAVRSYQYLQSTKHNQYAAVAQRSPHFPRLRTHMSLRRILRRCSEVQSRLDF